MIKSAVVLAVAFASLFACQESKADVSVSVRVGGNSISYVDYHRPIRVYRPYRVVHVYSYPRPVYYHYPRCHRHVRVYR